MWIVFKDGRKLLPYEDEPLEFQLNLPRSLFVVGCGGCSKSGRSLIDSNGNELLRRTWPDEPRDEAWDAELDAFYQQVRSHIKTESP